jgi:hypothetical protein
MRGALACLAAVGCGGGFHPSQQGTVAIQSGPTSAAALAEFDSAPSSRATLTVEDLGSCYVITATPDPNASSKMVSAGAIVIAGARQTVTLTPDANGSYAQFSETVGPLWRGGETVTITAAGDAVPAFSASETAASPVDVTAPALPAPGAQLTVDRTRDLAFAWSRGTAGRVQAALSPDAGDVSVACDFPTSAGMGAIPAAVLGRLPSGATGVVSLSGGGTDFHFVEAGGWSIAIQVGTNASWGGQDAPEPRFVAP